MSKYKARKVRYDGYIFDSHIERDRYIELKLLEKAGKISELVVHPRPFELIPKQRDELAITYRPDFMYKEKGRTVVEELKSKATAKVRDYVQRRKLFKFRYVNTDPPEFVFREIIR